MIVIYHLSLFQSCSSRICAFLSVWGFLGKCLVEWGQRPIGNGMTSVCVVWGTYPPSQFHGFEAAVLVHRSNPSGLVIPPMFQLQKYESQEHNPRWRLTFNWNWNLFTAIRFLANPKSTFRSNSCFHTSCSCWLCSSLAYASRAAQQNRILYIYIDIWTLAKYGKVLHSPYDAYFLSLQWNTHARTWVIMGIGYMSKSAPSKIKWFNGFHSTWSCSRKPRMQVSWSSNLGSAVPRVMFKGFVVGND